MRPWYALFPLVLTAIALMPADGSGQENSLMPAFPSLIIRKMENAQLLATYTRETDSLRMRVTSKVSRPEDGWGGVCLENRSPVDLTGYTHVSMIVEPSEPVVMDVKLEKTKFDEGALVLADKGSFPRGRKAYTWKLKDASEVSGSGTLGGTKRLCAFVLADDFPRGSGVTVTISRIRFDRK